MQELNETWNDWRVRSERQRYEIQPAPILRREALAAGSARIDAVSGASYTSAGYIQSLQSALDAARAAGA